METKPLAVPDPYVVTFPPDPPPGGGGPAGPLPPSTRPVGPIYGADGCTIIGWGVAVKVVNR
jgi:hypothetical protein